MMRKNGGSASKKYGWSLTIFENKINSYGLYRYFTPAYEGFAGLLILMVFFIDKDTQQGAIFLSVWCKYDGGCRLFVKER